MIGIYKIISPSNKVYIGQSVSIYERWDSYKRLKCKKQPKLYNSLIKHGWNKHIPELIEECPEEQLNEKETFYKQQFIDEFGWDKALFCQIKDGKGGHKSKETRDKISKGNTGKIRSEEYKLNQSNKMKGRKQSPETIQKRVEKNKGKKRTK